MGPALIAGGVFVILSIGGYALVSALNSSKDKVPRRRLKEEGQPPAERGQDKALADSAPLVTRLLHRTRLNDAIQWELLRAGLLIKPSEMIAISVAAGIGAYMVGLTFPPSLITRAFLLLIGLGSPWIYVQVRKQYRYKLLITQLPEALQLIASSLRSGFSILRAIEVVANEMPAPISREFRWVLDEVNVGVSMERAFTHMVRRTASPDVKLMVTAIQIQSSVGGDLAEVLDTTSTMIRERFQLTAYRRSGRTYRRRAPFCCHPRRLADRSGSVYPHAQPRVPTSTHCRANRHWNDDWGCIVNDIWPVDH